ncbi:hypothetical protein GQX74_003827 [Glossina fuscipes]|nr:hypothetical protein GQX74_003827 [Glossina fuscipes]
MDFYTELGGQESRFCHSVIEMHQSYMMWAQISLGQISRILRKPDISKDYQKAKREVATAELLAAVIIFPIIFCGELMLSRTIVIDSHATQFFHVIKFDVMNTDKCHHQYYDLDSAQDVAYEKTRKIDTVTTTNCQIKEDSILRSNFTIMPIRIA